MKLTVYSTVLALSFLACTKSSSDKSTPEDTSDLAPGSFEVMVDSITSNSAKINWTAAIDPEGTAVKYELWLNDLPIDTNITDLKYNLVELTELSNFVGRVVAKDLNGNRTSRSFVFTTEKYYLRFLKMYEYDINIDGLHPGGGEAKQIVRIDDNSLIIVGASYIDGSYVNGSQLMAMKIDNEGNEKWKKYYPFHVGPAYDVAATLSNGGLLMVCLRNVVKIDTDGNLLWSRNFANYEEIRGVAEDGNGNIFIAGGKNGVPPVTLQEGLISKLSPTGNQIWERAFSSSLRGFFYDVKVTSSDDVIVFGNLENNGLTDFWLLKLSNSGEQIWQSILGDERDDFAAKMLLRKDGNISLIGTSWGTASDRLGRIVDVSPTGAEVRSISFGIPLSFALSGAETNDGGTITTGFSDQISGSKILQINKFTTNGLEEWSQLHHESGTFFFGRCVVNASDGGYYILASEAGYYGYGRPAHIAVFKTDPLGRFE